METEFDKFYNELYRKVTCACSLSGMGKILAGLLSAPANLNVFCTQPPLCFFWSL